MKRRTVLIGLGASAVGGVAFGTGAFTSITADRDASVTIADEDQALLAMFPSDGANAEYATQNENNRNEIGLVFADADDNALGQNSTYTFDNVFVIQNRGTQEVNIQATIGDVDDHAGVNSFALYDTGSPNDKFSGDNDPVTIDPGEQINVGVEIETGDTGGETVTGEDAELSATITTGGTGSASPAETQASLSVSPQNPSPGETITLDGTGSTAGENANSIDTYTFEVYQGNNPNRDNEQPVFEQSSSSPTAEWDGGTQESGSYTAFLTVEDDQGTTDTTNETFTVSQEAEASLSVDPENPSLNEPVTLDGSNSTPAGGDGTVDTYSFEVYQGDNPDRDNEQPVFDQTGSEATAEWSDGAQSSGPYTSFLAITDDEGNTDETSVQFAVTEPAEPAEQFPREVTNARAQRAANAWRRGYRGRADRSLVAIETGADARHPDLGPWNGVKVNDGSIKSGGSGFSMPSPDEAPEMVAWWEQINGRAEPTDEEAEGHGTHVASIMTGSGHAVTFDPTSAVAAEPDQPVPEELPITYELEVEQQDIGSEVIAGASGRWISFTLETPDGSTTEQSLADGIFDSTQAPVAWSTAQNNNATSAWVRDRIEQAGTCTLTIELNNYPEANNGPVPDGFVTNARVRTIGMSVADNFADQKANRGPVETSDATTEGGLSLNPGVAPGSSLATFVEYSEGVEELSSNASEYADQFNMRAVNMSFGLTLGVPGTGPPIGTLPQTSLFNEAVRNFAQAGILPVASAGNLPGTPTGGQDSVQVAAESVSVVWTNRFDGIALQSSGGIGAIDDETTQPYGKPDVCAYGDTELAANSDGPGTDSDYGDVDTYVEKSGTSMAAPSTAGLAGLVADAMEDDGAAIDLPTPATLANKESNDARPEVLRLKGTLQATASTTAFNALPWHGDQAPTYVPGERDPYEGWGRINHGAAIDAVTHDLNEADGFRDSEMGLAVNFGDEQALAGYIDEPGEYTLSVTFEGYSGADADIAEAPPRLNLFVYDAKAPVGVTQDGERSSEPATGDPNDLGFATDPLPLALTVSVGQDDVYYVVAKLIDVPGAFNGADIQVEVSVSLNTETVN